MGYHRNQADQCGSRLDQLTGVLTGNTLKPAAWTQVCGAIHYYHLALSLLGIERKIRE